MTSNPPAEQLPADALPADALPVERDKTGLVVDTRHDMHANHRDPQHQAVQQDLTIGILPLAIASFLVLAFVVAAWTFLAAGAG